MKIALVHSPYKHKIFSENLSTVDDEFSLAPPIILAYVAAILEAHGHKVLLIDARTLNLSKEETLGCIRDFKADILGFRAETYHFHDALEWMGYLKEKLNIPVIAGGINLSLYPRETLSHKTIDYGIIGQAIVTLPAFLKAFAAGSAFEHIPGLGYKKQNGKIIINPVQDIGIDFDSYPMPARHLLPNDQYYSFISQRKNFTIMLTSVGCPFGCTFCAIPSAYNARSVQNVVNEIEVCYKEFHVREIDFFDAVLFKSRERDIEIMQELKKRKFDLEWSCRSRVDLVDEQILSLAANSGCRQIYFGIESINPQVLRNIKKNISKEKVSRAITLSKKFGIRPMGFFMVGNPGDTLKSIRQSIDFARELDLDYIQVCRSIAKPGTQLDKEMIQKTGRDLWREHVAGAPLKERLPAPWSSLTELEKESLTKEFYLRFYLRPRLIRERLFQLKSFTELKRYIKVAGKMIWQRSEVCLHILTDTQIAEKLLVQSNDYLDEARKCKAAFVIPTLNEKDNIENIIQEILKILPQAYIIIMDDDSIDGTGLIAKRMSKENIRIRFILRKANPGLGRSYIQGFNYVLDNLDVDYVFQMDADFSHNPQYIPLFLHFAKAHDMVAGSRFLKRVSIKNRTLWRNIISKTTKWFVNILLGLKVSDVTTGFKCFKRSALAAVDFNKIRSKGYAFQIEMSHILSKKGAAIKEIPILFIERTAGKSKMSAGIMCEGILLIARLSWQRLRNLLF
ncbi:MAG: glycosyltransferase [Candidatus Omnitrophota bacterium]